MKIETILLLSLIFLLSCMLQSKLIHAQNDNFPPNFAIRYNLTLVTGNGDKRGNNVPYNIVKVYPAGLAFSKKRNVIYASDNGVLRKIDLNSGLATLIELDQFFTLTNSGLMLMTFSNDESALYICLQRANKVIRMNFLPNGTEIFSHFAGSVNGNPGSSGEGVLAVNALLNEPSGLAVDSNGNVYISDAGNSMIRKVSNATGIITRFAGTGSAGFSGDGGLANNAKLNSPRGLAFGPNGDLFIADSENNVIRKVNGSGIISTVAGDTTPDYSGDGGDAKLARLKTPFDVIVSKSSELFISDYGNNCIRKVSSIGLISTIAGNKTAGSGFGGDGGDAKNSILSFVQGFTWSASDDLIFGDFRNSIRKIDKSTGIISSLTQQFPFTGDGANVDLSFLLYPKGICVNELSGDIFISEAYGDTVRKISKNGIITKIAGVGNANSEAGVENGNALSVALHFPSLIQCQANGDVYVADYFSNIVRLISSNGSITNVAGTGTPGYSGDGASATLAKLSSPHSVKVSSSGEIFIVDQSNQVIRKILKNGNIVTIAGKSGVMDYTGDGGPASNATLNNPRDLALAPNGDIYIADWSNNVIRKISATNGIISTVVGSGLKGPSSVTFKDGELFISDYNGIKKLTANGKLAHIAGVGNDQLFAPISQNYYPDATNVTIFTEQIHVMSNGDLLIGIGNGYDNGHIYKLSKQSSCSNSDYTKDSSNTFCFPTCFGYLADHGNVCSGNGSCIDSNKCKCNAGFKGDRCDEKIFIEPVKSASQPKPIPAVSSRIVQRSNRQVAASLSKATNHWGIETVCVLLSLLLISLFMN